MIPDSTFQIPSGGLSGSLESGTWNLESRLGEKGLDMGRALAQVIASMIAAILDSGNASHARIARPVRRSLGEGGRALCARRRTSMAAAR